MILSYLMLFVCYKCIVLFTMSISGSTLKMLEKLKEKNGYPAARNLDLRVRLRRVPTGPTRLFYAEI